MCVRDQDLLVGYSVDAKTGETRPVISGEVIFQMMDSRGLPLDVILECLGAESMAFDVQGFIQAARRSKNITDERIRKILEYNNPECSKDVLDRCFA